MSAFATALQDMLKMSDDPAVIAALKILLNEARGRKNAIPLGTLVARLKVEHDIHVDNRYLQHKLLILSRSNGGFLGSGHGGIYVIESPEDAKAMAVWYRERIATEQYHLSQLEKLAERKGWVI